MKINENNLRNVEAAYAEEATFTYDDISTMIDEPVAAKTNIVKAHPALAATMAVAFIAAPVAGIGITNLLSNAAEVPAEVVDDSALTATYVGQEETEEAPELTETTFAVASKTVEIGIEGPGHIEAVANCTVDGGKVSFEDADRDASIKLVADVDGASAEFKLGEETVAGTDDTIVLKAVDKYEDAKAVFVDVVAEQQAAEEAARQEEEARKVAEAAEAAKPAPAPVVTTPAPEPTYTYVEPEPVYEAPAPEPEPVYEAPAPEPEPVYEAPAAPSVPNSGMPQNGMSGEERAVAESIFNAYNNWRAGRGLPMVAWSEDCANMAWGSATGCAARGSLVHRLGIPGNLQTTYSDILQYATWKMDGAEAVSKWEGSTGHRRMMQCATAEVAGVAAYNNYGTWYYVIVYNFHGTNQSGN